MEQQSNFIKTIMENDLESKKHDLIITRFPPEPNGFLHIGHARAVIVNFELAKHFNGYTNLRYDDTNPVKEDELYVKGILEDVRWLGYEPKNIFFASDYFDEMFERAVILIKKGLAYVDHLTPDEIAKQRGNITTKGNESPYRKRLVDENMQLFLDMKAGKFKEGECVLRAKIDMSSPNMNMRDPVIYRIVYANHHNTKDKWCIYPMYDYAHPLEDAIEGITHSLCSLEFEDHRPLYDWFVNHTKMPKVPRQIEFGRLSIENSVMSKRHLRTLVEEGKVIGWDDPRMPTLLGLRRRGYTPQAIRNFHLSVGLSKINTTMGTDMLESAIRDDLQDKAKRAMAIIDPLKVTITNYPNNQVEMLDVPFHNEQPDLGIRQIPFSKHLYIEREDFIPIKPNKKYKRLSLNDEVRLFHAYFIHCHDIVYDTQGEIQEILVTYDIKTKSGSGFDQRKPNGTIHFVEATTAVPAKFNFFGPLIQSDEQDKPLLEQFNEQSWIVKKGYVEKALSHTKREEKFQFLRNGYFSADYETKDNDPVFNEVVPLKQSFK